MEDENSDNNYEKITIKKSTFNKMLMGIIAATLVSAFLGGYVLGGETVEPEKMSLQDVKDILGSTTPSSNQLQTGPQLIQVSLDDDPVKGDPNAPFTIIEFSDFQCPFCMKFHTQTLPLIEENYINTGKVKFVYRDFPIQSIHPNAFPAALASECADEQGMFWEFHDMVFVNQKTWERQDVVQSAQTFQQFAADIGLDMESFNTCFATAKYSDEINKDLRDGQVYGVTGTPGFFIGNEKIGFIKISGAQPYSVFQQVLDDLGA